MAPYLGLKGHRLTLAALLLVVSPAFLSYGYNQAVLGGLLTLDSFVEAFPEMDTVNTSGQERTHNANIQGTVVALYVLGGMFGSLSCVRLGDQLGRRWVIFLASGISILGAILMTSAFSLAQMIVARIILGIGVGGTTATVPVWHAELSKPSKRGADVVTTGFFIGAGLAISLWVDFGCFFIHSNSIAWRLPLALQILLSLTVMTTIFLLPESPRWLAKRGRLEEARAVLAALDDTASINSPEIDRSLTAIQSSLALCRSTSLWDLFKSNSTTTTTNNNNQRMRHRTILAVLGQSFQQLCGINALSFYATTIFEQYLGLSPTKSRILAAAMATTQPIGGIITYFCIDSFGRRRLMLTAASSMLVLMAVLAGTTSATSNNAALIVAVIALFLFPFIFTIGFAGVTFLYATEIAPSTHRAAINALSTCAVWTANFLLAEVTPVAFASIGWRYYIVFAVLNAGIVVVVWVFFPETAGLALEEVDEIFTESRSVFDATKVAWRMRQKRRADMPDEGRAVDGVVEVYEAGDGGGDVKA